MHPAKHRHAKRAVVKGNSNAVKPTIAHGLEMQRWMTRVCFELREITMGYGLNL